MSIALIKAKNNKAPGPENIRMEFLKHAGRNVANYIKKKYLTRLMEDKKFL